MVIFIGAVHATITLMFMYMLNPEFDPAYINLWFILGGIIGSYLPDCDHRKSMASAIPLYLFFKHRTYTHSLFFLTLFSGLAWLLSDMLGYGIALGYFLHLAGDSTTYMGQKYGMPYLFWVPGRHIINQYEIDKAA